MAISTALLNLVRSDWAEADTVAGDPTGMRLWNQLRSVAANEKVIYVKPNTGLGYADLAEEGDPNPEKLPATLSQLTLTQKRRGVKYGFTIEAQAFDLYGKVSDMGREAVKAIKRRKCKEGADFFLNNAFSVNIATGQPLYSASHSINGTTFSNLGSAAALTESAVESGLVALLGQRGPKGEAIAYDGKVLLVVPPALAVKAAKIAQSAQVPGVADNDKNVVAAQLEVLVEPEATTSSTAYALIAANTSDLHCYKAVNTEIANGMDTDEDGNVKMTKWTIYGVGATLPYNTWGNAGA